jgi:hypothetical protein
VLEHQDTDTLIVTFVHGYDTFYDMMKRITHFGLFGAAYEQKVRCNDGDYWIHFMFRYPECYVGRAFFCIGRFTLLFSYDTFMTYDLRH